METLILVMQMIPILVVAYILAVLIVGIIGMFLASFGIYFVSPEKGKTTIIMRGGDLKAIWPNVGSHRLSSQEDFNGLRWITKDDGPGSWYRWYKSFFHTAFPGTKFFQFLVWKYFGVRFISWFWPWVKVHRFGVSRMHLKEESTSDPNRSLAERIVPSPRNNEPVDALLQFAPRPISKRSLELAGDNSQVEILFLARFQAIIPTMAVLNLEGDYYPLLDAAVQAAVVDFGANHRVAVDENGVFIEDSYDPRKASDSYRPAPLTYDHWIKIGTGVGSLIERHVLKINVSHAYCKRLEAEGKTELLGHLKQLGVVPAENSNVLPEGELTESQREKVADGIIPGIGFALINLEIVDRDSTGQTADLAAAAREKETERLRADGVRQRALGRRDADKEIAAGHAALFGLPVEALTKLGVSPDAAARVLETDMRTRNIGGESSKVTTYIEGGGGEKTGVMIPTTPPPAPAPKPEPPSTS